MRISDFSILSGMYVDLIKKMFFVFITMLGTEAAQCSHYHYGEDGLVLKQWKL